MANPALPIPDVHDEESSEKGCTDQNLGAVDHASPSQKTEVQRAN